MASPRTSDQDLVMLTAKEAAELLGCDPKTFRKLPVPYILAGTSRRYTREILKDWQTRSVQCPSDQSDGPKVVRFPASNTSAKGRARKSGKSRFASAAFDFEQVAGLRTE